MLSRITCTFLFVFCSNPADVMGQESRYIGISASPGGGELRVSNFPLTMGGGQIALYGGLIESRGDLVFAIEGQLDVLPTTRFYDIVQFGSYYSGLWQVGPMASVRARVGLRVDRFTPYLTAGVAVAASSVTFNYYPRVLTQTSVGTVAGTGIEYAVNDDVSIRVEYLRTDLGTVQYPLFDGETYNVAYVLDAARLGVSFRF